MDRLEAKLDGAVSAGNSDFGRLEGKLGDAVAGLNAKIDDAVSAGKSDLDDAVSGVKLELKAEVARLDTKFDAMDHKLDGMEKGLDEKIDGKFDSLNGKINVLIGFVGIMLAAVFGFAFLAMAPNVSWAEPQAALRDAADPSAAAQAHTAPPEPTSGALPATTSTSPPAKQQFAFWPAAAWDEGVSVPEGGLTT